MTQVVEHLEAWALVSRFSPALVRFRLNVSYYLDPHDNSVSCRKQPFKVFAYVFLIRDPTLPVIKITRCGINRQFLVCLVNRKVIRDRLVIWALKGQFLGIILGAILEDFRPYFC